MSAAAVDAFAGGIGSLIALVSTYPLKTIYTLQAIEAKRRGDTQRAGILKLAATEPQLLLHHVLSKLKGDWKGLYTGLQPAAVETVASTAVYFYFYSLLKQAVAAQQRRRQLASGQAGKLSADIGVAASLAVAALAGAGNMLITTPAAVVTTQMQAQHKQRQQQAANSAYTGPPPPTAASVSRQIWQQDGITGFWKGLMPSLILVVNPAVQYMLFEGLMTRALKLRIKQQQRTGAAPAKGTPRLGVGDVFLLGALAKIGATVVTYPMIVVKARLQAINEETDTEMQYSGTWDAICTIVRDEGVPGFFKGMGAKLAQTALNAALMLVVRDKVNEVARATAAKVLRPQVAGGAQQVAVIRR